MNTVGKFIEEYNSLFSYPVNGRPEKLRDNDTENPVGTELSFRPMTLPPSEMSTSMGGGNLNFDLKTISARF